MTSRDASSEKCPERLNLPGLMARTFIESRLTVLLMIGLLMFGLVGLTFTPREENPQIIVPAAEVVIDFPGALPEEVEHRLLSPLEAELLSIDGVKQVYGSALDGRALVQIEFEVGEDKERALVRLYDRVFRFRLPDGAGQAHIRAIDVDDVPVFTLTLTSSEYDDYTLRRMGERVVERLRSVKGVGQSDVIGGREREIRLETTPERLASFQIPLDQNDIRHDQGAAEDIRVFPQSGRGEEFLSDTGLSIDLSETGGERLGGYGLGVRREIARPASENRKPEINYVII